MEIANLNDLRGRPATAADARAIHRLLRRGDYVHLHVDWRPPVEWLDRPGALLMETTGDHPAGPGHLRGCLVVAADPRPAAWVRIFALHRAAQARSLLAAMLDAILPALRQAGVQQVGWLPREGLPPSWAEEAGFSLVNEVETFVKEDLALPAGIHLHQQVQIRPLQAADLPRLAAVEAAAFDPLWRHSVGGLRLGWHHARSFHVALLDGQIVGFQYSTDSDRSRTAHLVRLTVSPHVQRRGIGTALMVAALDSYRRQGVERVSLNTQVDNLASKRLYEKFGFKSVEQRLPVWCRPL